MFLPTHNLDLWIACKTLGECFCAMQSGVFIGHSSFDSFSKHLQHTLQHLFYYLDFPSLDPNLWVFFLTKWIGSPWIPTYANTL